MKYLSLILSSLLFIACTTADQKQSNSPATDEKVVVQRNGINMYYQQCGAGDTSILFVHGWCINSGYWQAQMDRFCESYQVVAMDLPGFGQSGKNRTNWTIPEFGLDVAAVIDQLKLDPVILVGHSMAGDIVLEAALQRPDQVIGLIGVDNFKEVGLEYTEEDTEELTSFFSIMADDFINISSSFAENALFLPNSNPTAKQRVIADFQRADPNIAVPCLRALFDYHDTEWNQLKRLDKKLLLINSDATPTPQEGLTELGVDFEILQIPATGHYPMIEKPSMFNQLLKQAIGRF